MLTRVERKARELAANKINLTQLTSLSAISPPTGANKTYGTEIERRTRPVLSGVRPNCMSGVFVSHKIDYAMLSPSLYSIQALNPPYKAT